MPAAWPGAEEKKYREEVKDDVQMIAPRSPNSEGFKRYQQLDIREKIWGPDDTKNSTTRFFYSMWYTAFEAQYQNEKLYLW